MSTEPLPNRLNVFRFGRPPHNVLGVGPKRILMVLPGTASVATDAGGPAATGGGRRVARPDREDVATALRVRLKTVDKRRAKRPAAMA
ncbi:hypothetical protein [Streptomyces sp. NPDC002394]